MHETILLCLTDKFMKFAVNEKNFTLQEIKDTCKKIGVNKSQLEDVNKKLYEAFFEFAEKYMAEEMNIYDFINEFDVRTNRYFNTTSECLEYIAHHDLVELGHQIMFAKDANEVGNEITLVFIITTQGEYIHDYVILNS